MALKEMVQALYRSTHKAIAKSLVAFPNLSYPQIAEKHGVSCTTVEVVAKEIGHRRKIGRKPAVKLVAADSNSTKA